MPFGNTEICSDTARNWRNAFRRHGAVIQLYSSDLVPHSDLVGPGFLVHDLLQLRYHASASIVLEFILLVMLDLVRLARNVALAGPCCVEG